jgi:hypothetical protein
MGGMLTELDDGVFNVINALKSKGMWNDTLLIFVSDNGGPLEHSTNAPLRGGKHTFFEASRGGMKAVWVLVRTSLGLSASSWRITAGGHPRYSVSQWRSSPVPACGPDVGWYGARIGLVPDAH